MSNEDVGERAQWLFCLLITSLCGRNEPYFRPRFLGGTYPTFDYIVELVDSPAYYFFAQVKGTTLGYTENPRRLRAQLGQDAVDRMVACPAPTCLVGVDVTSTAVGFLLSINEPREHIASLTTRFSITCDLLRDLQNEVYGYWSCRDMLLRGSRFRE